MSDKEQKDRDDCKAAFAEWKKTPTCENMLHVIPEHSLNIAFYWGFMYASKRDEKPAEPVPQKPPPLEPQMIQEGQTRKKPGKKKK